LKKLTQRLELNEYTPKKQRTKGPLLAKTKIVQAPLKNPTSPFARCAKNRGGNCHKEESENLSPERRKSSAKKKERRKNQGGGRKFHAREGRRVVGLLPKGEFLVI